MDIVSALVYWMNRTDEQSSMSIFFYTYVSTKLSSHNNPWVDTFITLNSTDGNNLVLLIKVNKGKLRGKENRESTFRYTLLSIFNQKCPFTSNLPGLILFRCLK